MQQNKVLKKTTNSWFVSTRPYTLLEDDVENDSRGYRILYNYFGRCVRNFIKLHKQCLPQIDDMYVVKIPKEQLQLIQQNVDKFLLKYIDKLKKQAMGRNISIYKNMLNYKQQHQQFVNFTIQNQEKQQGEQKQLKYNSYDNEEISPIKSFSKALARPYSSIVPKSRHISIISSQSSRIRKKYTDHPRQQEVNKSMLMCQTERIKNNSQDQQQIQLIKKASLLLQNETVFIYDRRINSLNCRIQNQKSFTPSFIPKCSKNHGKTVKQAYCKLIQQRDKQQLQNRIFMINSSLAVNLARSQGYKPRSHCRRKQIL